MDNETTHKAASNDLDDLFEQTVGDPAASEEAAN